MWLIAQAVTVAAGLASYPFDTVRKRIMLDAGRKEMVYKDGLDCFAKILQKEGVRGLYRAAYIPILLS